MRPLPLSSIALCALLLVSANSTTAAEPDQAMIDAGWTQFKNMKKTPYPLYVSKDAKSGTLTISQKGGKAHADAKGITARTIIGWCSDCGWEPKDGDVLYNVSTTPLKVGDLELKKGDCAEFKNGKFEKADYKINVKK